MSKTDTVAAEWEATLRAAEASDPKVGAVIRKGGRKPGKAPEAPKPTAGPLGPDDLEKTLTGGGYTVVDPIPKADPKDLRPLVETTYNGLAKALGVSEFDSADLDRIAETACPVIDKYGGGWFAQHLPAFIFTGALAAPIIKKLPEIEAARDKPQDPDPVEVGVEEF